MAQIARIPGLTSGGGRINHRSLDAMAFGLGVGATVAIAPAVVPAVRFTAMSATGVVPMLGESIAFLANRKWITLAASFTAGLAVSNAVGVVNIYVHRDNLTSFARDKFNWFLANAESDVASGYENSQKKKKTRTLVRSGGRSRDGRGATTLSQRASRSVRFGKRRRRCRYRNKSGKTCLRPRNHSGRHRWI